MHCNHWKLWFGKNSDGKPTGSVSLLDQKRIVGKSQPHGVFIRCIWKLWDSWKQEQFSLCENYPSNFHFFLFSFLSISFHSLHCFTLSFIHWSLQNAYSFFSLSSLQIQYSTDFKVSDMHTSYQLLEKSRHCILWLSTQQSNKNRSSVLQIQYSMYVLKLFWLFVYCSWSDYFFWNRF